MERQRKNTRDQWIVDKLDGTIKELEELKNAFELHIQRGPDSEGSVYVMASGYIGTAIDNLQHIDSRLYGLDPQ